MADINIELVTNLDGLDVLEAVLNEGSPRAAKKYLRRAEMKGTKILVDALETAAPVESGKLETEIGRQTVLTEDALTVRVGPSQNAFYGGMQEWGAPEAGVAATHWAERAARGVESRVLEEFYTALQEGLDSMAENAPGPNLGGSAGKR